jgi:DNA-binding phage protein
MNKLNKEQWENARKEIEEGKTIVQVAKENDISRTAIYSYGERHWGWEKKKRRNIKMNKLNKEQWENARKEIEEGKTIVQVAKENDISRTAIYSYGERHWGWEKKKKSIIWKFIKLAVLGRWEK